MTNTTTAAEAEERSLLETYLTAEQVCQLVPNLSKSNLAQRRYKGLPPKFLAPTPRTILYRESDIIAWLESSERTGTAEARA